MSRTRNPTLSGYRFMWILVMFDLPVGTKAERRPGFAIGCWMKAMR
jgi:CRISPR-associated protein Cas2